MSSIIAESASIGENTTVGHFCVIDENVVIGSGCRIGHHVIIHPDTVIGDDCVIDDHAVVGKAPLRSRSMAIQPGEGLPGLKVASGVVIGTGAILFRGSQVGEEALIADLASVREETTIGASTIIGRCVAVENRISIGNRCKIEAGAFVCAYSTIADDCFVAPEVTLTNDNYMGRTEDRTVVFKGSTLERGARVGANATILPGKQLSSEAVAGAGSVVTRDIPADTINIGSPARKFGPVPPEQKLNR